MLKTMNAPRDVSYEEGLLHMPSLRLITASEKSDTFTDRLGLLFEVDT